MHTGLKRLFERVNIGEPAAFGGMKVFPLFPLDRSAVRYRLLASALGEGTAQIDELTESEIHESGASWFQRLAIRNDGLVPLLVRDADVLTGGKQDRKADATCIVERGVRAIVPVVCVEAGRSSYRDEARFTSARSSADLELRRLSYASDKQSRTWEHVGRRRSQSGLADESGTFAELAGNPEYVAALPPVLNACGLVIAANGRIEAAEIHADIEACAIAWSALIAGVAQSLAPQARAPRLSRTELRKWLAQVARASSEPHAGSERLSFEGGKGTAVSLGAQLAHVALIAA